MTSSSLIRIREQSNKRILLPTTAHVAAFPRSFKYLAKQAIGPRVKVDNSSVDLWLIVNFN